MQSSKILLALFLFIALTAAVPVPLFENLFNKNKDSEGEKKGGLFGEGGLFGKKDDGEKKSSIFDIFKKKDVENGSAQAPATQTPSAPAQVSAETSAQTSTQTSSQNPIFDINNIPQDADVATVVTTSVSNLLKNNLCNTLGNGANTLCENISSNVLNSISGILKTVIQKSINSASGNTLSIACAIIPNDIFKNLTGAIANAISSSVAKNNGGNTENVSTMTNNIITIIINTVSHLLCSGGSTGADGNVIVSNITNLINNITHKASYMNENVSSSLVNGSQLIGTDKNIAEGFSDIQESIKMQYKAYYQQSNEINENGAYQTTNDYQQTNNYENYRNYY